MEVQNFSPWLSELLKVEGRRKLQNGTLESVQTAGTVALVLGWRGSESERGNVGKG
jgi:hypothetical protein